MAIVLIAIGLLFTGVDFMVGSGISYPDFIQPTGLYHGIDIHPRIQQYVTQNILGHNLQVDILPDVIGCLLVLIGAFMFVKHNKKFWFGVLSGRRVFHCPSRHSVLCEWWSLDFICPQFIFLSICI